MLAEDEARAAVLAAAKGMLERGLTSGTSGNMSARLAGGTMGGHVPLPAATLETFGAAYRRGRAQPPSP